MIETVLRCDFLEPSQWLLFGANVPPLVYYTHIPNLTISLLLAIFVLLQSPRALPNRILFATVLAFITWVFFALMFWATNRADIIMFAWLIDILVEPLVHIGILYLLYTLLTGKDLSIYKKLALFVLYLPIPLLVPTPLTLSAVDTISCLAIEGPIALYYTYFVEIIVTLLLIVFLIKRFLLTTDAKKRREIFFLGIGGILLLFAFSWGNIVGSFTEDWQLGQYGLLGMPLFIGFLVYSIVRFSLFNIKIFATQALVITSWFTLFALLFVNNIDSARIVIGVNLVIFGIFGYQLIRSVRREIKQREQIELLAKRLAKANERLKELDKMKSEFVSVASHQLRSPLTSIRGYASMILEGSFGKVPLKAREAIERIAESSKYMAISVEDYLNVSRIEAGNMKYEYSTFNIKEETEKIVKELHPTALKRGLKLKATSTCKGTCIVKADIGKLRQVVQNVVDNAMKYTPKGSITVTTHDDLKQKKVFVTIKDTGVGMSKDTIEDLFNKFTRAKNANEVNVTGTGLGLFVAKKMVEDMGGKIWAESEGEGKGSEFIIEFPLSA